jgi:serine/threonine-protein kinase
MLDPGARLGPYEVISALGAGGMGEVYRARDTRLDRSVAIKILPAALAVDAAFRERFDREARAISQLTHDNICTLHDVGEHEGTAYLVMQLLEGETLEARLEKGALPVDQALAIAIQIAGALSAAHRAGIVHRDLKPGNIFLTRTSGASAPPTAKLLDFGLAKTATPVVAPGGLSMAPTTPPATMTAAGTILGTFQYMAPEQIEGMEADARTDLFAFGCVLFEMLTGRKAFEGKTRASLLGAILKDEPPPVSQVIDARLKPWRSNVPEGLDRIVQTCLAKDRDDRWQTARDLLRELKWVAANLVNREHPETPNPDRGARRSSGANRASLWLAATASAIIAGLAVWLFSRPAPSPRRVIRLDASAPRSAPLFIDGITSDLAMSPDGTRIAFLAGGGQAQLWVRQIDRPDAVQLPGILNARGPFFSPDGEWIGYFQFGDLKKVSFHGGPPLTVCNKCGDGNRGATWGANGIIVFAYAGGSQGLQQVPAAGGEVTSFSKPDASKREQAHLWPAFVPGTNAIVYTVNVGGAESTRILWRDLKTGRQETLLSGGSHPRYVAGGHLMYAVSGTLWAIPCDPARGTVTGAAFPVIENVLTKPTGSADFAVSDDGSLAYISGDASSTGQRLAWIDRKGHEEPIDAPPKGYLYVRLSPDGHRAAVDVRDQQNDIWVWDFDRHVMTRLTTDPSPDQSPVWTPDGQRIAFGSQREGIMNVYWQLADGSGSAERLTRSPHIQVPWFFTSDGKTLGLRDTDPQTGPDIALMSFEGDRSVRRLIHTADAELSPDGRWIAYNSDESGRLEVAVRPFPNVDNGHWQISTDGGSRPLWNRNGRELFFVDLAGRLMSVQVQTAAGSFVTSTPTLVFEGITGAGSLGRNYDVSPDGQRFLVTKSAGADARILPRFEFALNWAEVLKRVAPA